MAISKAIFSCVDQLPALLCLSNWCHGTPSFQMASTPMLCFIRNGMYTAGDPGITRASAHALSYHNASSSLYTALSTEIDADVVLESGQRAGGPHLCSLPACRVPISSNIAVPFAEIETTVGNILDTPTATIVILAANNSEFNIWRKLMREIHSIFNGSTVEVIDLELEIEPGCFPICLMGYAKHGMSSAGTYSTSSTSSTGRDLSAGDMGDSQILLEILLL